MIPKKSIVERAERNGTMYRVNILLSAAHLAAGISNNLFSEAGDLLTDAGMQIGTLKKTFNVYQIAADRYFSDFATMIDNEKVKKAFFSDLDDYTLAFRAFVGIEEGFKTTTNGEQYRPDPGEVVKAKKGQIKHLMRMVNELEEQVTNIKGKMLLSEYGLRKGQYFIYRETEYGNASSDGSFLYGHKIKNDGSLYKNKIVIFCKNKDITPIDKFVEE